MHYSNNVFTVYLKENACLRFKLGGVQSALDERSQIVSLICELFFP